MGLLLRPGVYYAETPQGAHMVTHDGEFAFTGRSIYQLIDRLAPLLDGRYTLAELTGHLPAERQTMVQELVTALMERGVLRDAEPAAMPDTGPAGHEHDVAFTGFFRDYPANAFRAYQDKVTLVLGAGRLCGAVAIAAARSGLHEVRVVTTSECPTEIAPDCCGWRLGWRGGGPPATESDSRVRSLLEGVDLVLHASDRPMVRRARLLDDVCAELDIPLAQALVVDRHAWIASRGIGSPVGGGWTSGWRRFAARRPGATRGWSWQDPPSDSAPDEVCATAVANQLVHDVFQSITRPAEAVGNRMVRVDLATLRSEVCTFVPHPFVGENNTATDFADRIGRLREGPRLAEETFSRRAAVCASDQVGIFGDPVEREFAQLPLHVCEIEVADPVGLLDPGGLATKVTGVGLDFATARYQAALKAFAVYASLMVDPRRLSSVAPGLVDSRADPDGMLSALQQGRLTGLVRGYGIAHGDDHLVDARQVFPAMRAPASPYVPPPGVAAGYDWHEAVTAGMVGQCGDLTMRNLAMSTTPFPRIDLAGAELDVRGDRYRALLAAIGETVIVYNVTGPLGVPTVVGYLGSVAAGHASSLSVAGAVTDMLEQLLLHYQARMNHQPDYAPAPVPDIPHDLRGTATLPLADAPAGDATAVATVLQERGHRLIAVPLDHDSEVNALMPYTVHVVISHD